MPRFLLVAASLFVALPALAQSVTTDVPSQPVSVQAPVALPSDVLEATALAADSLTTEQLARRIAHLYTRQAALLETEASGDIHAYQRRLDDLVMDLNMLAQRPGVMLSPRFREVYGSILTEYETFYGEDALDRGEIYRLREEAFAALNDVDQPTLADVELPQPAERIAEKTVFPMTVNRLVDRSLRFLLDRPGHTSRLRQRADTYFPMIERVLREEGVPDELKYLAMVESALNPVARSHAGAAGLWQFIPATGGAYGLQVTRTIDERLNPEKSTRAAARHLRDLYDRFEDWQLALAGYNMNPARVARYARQFEERTGRKATYWDIYDRLPNETRGYVPMYIATALVLSNPDAYGLPTVEPGPAFTFDRVPVQGGTRLQDVAQTIGVGEEVLRALNPSLRRGEVPSLRIPWMIRIPSGFYTQYAEQLDALASPEAAASERYAAETVRFGLRNSRPIAPMEPSEVLLAASGRATPEPRRAAPSPEPQQQPPVRLVSDARETPRTETPPEDTTNEPSANEDEARPEPPAEPATTHRVRRGQTLSGIAARYGVSTRQIMQWNNLSSSTIRVGQRLAVHADAAGAPAVRTHRVRRGENLTLIARRYGVSVSQIQSWNDLSSSTIRPGQRLTIRGGSAPRATTHRVRRGENLTTIARRYGVTVRQIMTWNDLSSSTIRPGQRLRIEPRGGVIG